MSGWLYCYYYTGKPPPAGAILLTTDLKAGVSKICRKNGIFRKNESAVGKNALNSNQNPYNSTTKPTRVHPHTTNTKPPRKKPLPL